jgi:rubrerythrin
MSDLSKRNNNTPTKKGHGTSVFLGVVGNFIFQCLWILGGAVMSGFTAYSAYINLPLYLVILLALGVFCISIWGLYGLGRFADWLKNRTKNEETDDLSISSEEREEKHRQQIEGHRKENSRIRKELQTEIAELKGDLEKNKWLFELATKQKNNIIRHIILTRGFYCFANLDDDIPHINFGLDIRNNSVYWIVFDEKINGYIEFDGKRLCGDLIIVSGFGFLSPMSNGTLTIQQRLTPAELPLLKKHLHLKGNRFRINKLGLIFKGHENSKEIGQHELEINNEFAGEENICAEQIEIIDIKNKEIRSLKEVIEKNKIIKEQFKKIMEMVEMSKIPKEVTAPRHIPGNWKCTSCGHSFPSLGYVPKDADDVLCGLCHRSRNPNRVPF